MPVDEQGSGNGRKPDVQHAISHPIRREILRALVDAPAPMTVAELDELVPAANVSTLNYHIGVLEREACITRDGEVVLSNGVLPTYVATVADDDYVIGVLASTRKGDEQR